MEQMWLATAKEADRLADGEGRKDSFVASIQQITESEEPPPFCPKVMEQMWLTTAQDAVWIEKTSSTEVQKTLSELPPRAIVMEQLWLGTAQEVVRQEENCPSSDDVSIRAPSFFPRATMMQMWLETAQDVVRQERAKDDNDGDTASGTVDATVRREQRHYISGNNNGDGTPNLRRPPFRTFALEDMVGLGRQTRPQVERKVSLAASATSSSSYSSSSCCSFVLDRELEWARSRRPHRFVRRSHLVPSSEKIFGRREDATLWPGSSSTTRAEQLLTLLHHSRPALRIDSASGLGDKAAQMEDDPARKVSHSTAFDTSAAKAIQKTEDIELQPLSDNNVDRPLSSSKAYSAMKDNIRRKKHHVNPDDDEKSTSSTAMMGDSASSFCFSNDDTEIEEMQPQPFFFFTDSAKDKQTIWQAPFLSLTDALGYGLPRRSGV
ncbi:hypothetical protein ACA910_006760 [Epithemia clementina (nom. ined.)]